MDGRGRKNSAESVDQRSVRRCKPFFLNVTLLNKDEVVASKVAEKAGSGIFGRAAAFAANKLISDDKIVENLAEKLIDGVHSATSELGIEAEMEVKFQHGPFVVIRVQVVDVDTLQLILSAKGEEFATNFSTLLVAATSLGLKDTVESRVDDKVFSSINEGMMAKFRDLIPQKMATQGVVVECQVASVEDEADLFFDIMSHLK